MRYSFYVRIWLYSLATLHATMAEENPFAKLFTKPTKSIQLAVLQPGSREAQLEIILTGADTTGTSYDCISYDRSQDYGTVEISVDKESLAIPKPLESALRALRLEGQPRKLWADLLIGSSNEERSKQAAVMKSVVQDADEVIAWLGPGDEHTGAAFDAIKTMANRWQQARLHTGFPHNLARATQQQMIDLNEYMLSKPADEFQALGADVWKSIEDIFSSNYFASAQTIPEILLAKKAVLASGPHRISWADYVSAGRAAPFIMHQQLGKTLSKAHLYCFEQVNSLEVANTRRQQGETLELLPMMHSSRDCSTSDPREIVFSMLPIITPSARTSDTGWKQAPLEADYAKSTADVFTEAARYIVHERQDLLLWWNESPPRRRKVKDLPSWVPDWSTPNPKKALKINPTSGVNGMRTWFEYIAPPPKRISVDDSNALHVQAHALDRVASVSPVFTKENCRRLCLKEWQALPTLPGEMFEDKVKRMFRTPLLNQAGTGATMRETATPPSEMWISFQSILAEERILEVLGCTLEQLMTQPEHVERMKAHPDLDILGPRTGRSQAFEQLLRSNAIGRRFFRTESGRTGMTAVEAGPGDAGRAEGERQVPNFDGVMADPLGRMILSGFQDFLRRQDPNAAGVLSQALGGTLPGQAAPGVRAGDLVVALVGGFQPYILRPAAEYEAGGESAAQSLESVSKYVYVGDCYLDEVMNGEPFKTKGWFGTETWTREVKLVDITIV